MIQGYNSVSTLHYAAPSQATVSPKHTDVAVISPTPAKNDRDVTLSDEAKILSASDTVISMDTADGNKNIDLDTFFLPKAGNEGLSLDNLLLPSSKNVEALRDHISSVFPEFLADNDIPEAPAQIRYNNAGEIVLPDDYAYAEELKAALNNEPAMERELRTVNALASHLAALKELEPFHAEFALANTQAQIDATIEKYSYLFDDNRKHPEVSLSFNDKGVMNVNANDRPLV